MRFAPVAICDFLGWDEEDVLFDEGINGKLAESWAYHELSAQTDFSGDCEISHYRDSDKREIVFIIERGGKEAISPLPNFATLSKIDKLENLKVGKLTEIYI